MSVENILKKVNVRFYIALAIGLLASGFIYYFTNSSIENVKASIVTLTSKRTKINESAMMFNIYFLRARRAEKSLIITNDPKYEKEINLSLQEAGGCLTSLEALTVDSSERDLVFALRKNTADYKEALGSLIAMVIAHEENQEKSSELMARLRDINDMLAENVTYLITKNRNAIETEQSRAGKSLSNLGILPGVIIVTAIVAIGMATATLLVGRE